MRLLPYGDRVIVERLDKSGETMYHGLILLPDTSKEKPTLCRVVAVGPGRYDAASGRVEPMVAKPGDLVLLSKYAGSEVQLGDDKKYVVCRHDEILTGVDPEDTKIEDVKIAAAATY